MGDPYQNTIFEGANPVDFTSASSALGVDNITDNLSVTPAGSSLGGSGFTGFGSPFSSVGAETSFFGGLGDIAQAAGNLMTAGNYRAAAKQYDYQSDLQREGVALGEYSVNQSLGATLGAQRSEVAAAGLAQTGSAVYLARQVAAQGAQARAKVQFQGEQNEQQLEEEAKAANSAAQSASFAGIFGGVLGIAKVAGSFFGI